MTAARRIRPAERGFDAGAGWLSTSNPVTAAVAGGDAPDEEPAAGTAAAAESGAPGQSSPEKCT